MLTDEVRERVLCCLLVVQRHSWDQGLTAAVLDDSGAAVALRALVDDAVARQLPDGRLAELDPACAVNGAALGEFVDSLAHRLGDPALAAAAARQHGWLRAGAPRAADGTLFHLVGSRQVWADTVHMVVPFLACRGDGAAAVAQLAGHRARLRDPVSGLWAARWDEDAGAFADPRAWGTGNGWVAAGAARAVRWLPGAAGTTVAGEVRALLDAVLPLRRPDGLFGDVLDDPATPADTNVASMFAFAALTGAAEGWLPARYGDLGESLLAAVCDRVDELGRVTGASAAPHFDRPGHSPEAQAFLLLADAADRRRRTGRSP
ncbi:glycoside hydrolase family 88 protein [Modestobacter sp. VKM Ac-2984]|uniref:glycoside hydrolase family 88 protein n=1 Tax=Modestobacter sp. VKM Ac-2984 TaxID=3004138 RepID=UPI0022AA8AEA|nr:glycoside hydrolase family 88 protein [Modestobacter sp. VKM Ac-2984]MCZ2817443.1 glycoside hydrolase family 88 protein [Modestobacter sp. VKM Ac-2984]